MIKPKRRLLSAVPRSFDRIDEKLVELFRRLVTGKAAWPIYLYGPVGSGKTRAALCLCDIADTAVYATVEGMASFTMRNDADTVEGEWERIEGKSLAILDELGERERVGDLHYTTVKRFADCREAHADRIAIYISNLEPGALATVYDDRIASRLLAGTAFELSGEDRRRRA